VLSAAVTVVLAVLLLMAGPQLLGIFCKEDAVIAEGLKIIRITFPLYFLYAILEVTGGIIRGMGKTLQSMFIVIATLCGVRILLLNLFVHYSHSIRAVAAVYPATWALAAASFVIYYQYLNRQMIRKNA
jgi:Na+-driven multidrug efflux pump